MMDNQVKSGIEVEVKSEGPKAWSAARTHYINRFDSVERISTGSYVMVHLVLVRRSFVIPYVPWYHRTNLKEV